MTLTEEINKRRQSIHTDGYPMSIGELLNLYRDNELDIHPEFQRFFRWSDTQKSRLIESLLLGIPIPSIFVQQREDGVWDVIDGLQRLSTIFQLVGTLRNEQDNPVEPFVLKGTEYLPALEGKTWESSDSELCLDRDQQLLIKRSKIDVKIILRESSSESKYELFQRLNTGGSVLSDQELRNCLIIMVNKEFYHWIESLAKTEEFQSCITLSDKARREQYDLELLLRFLIFISISEDQVKYVGDVGDFLSKQVVLAATSKNFDYTKNTVVFKDTFTAIWKAVGESAFVRYDEQQRRTRGGFLISAFEAVAIGLGRNIINGTADMNTDNIKQKIFHMWSDPAFTESIGSGINASSRIARVIPFGESLFNNETTSNDRIRTTSVTRTRNA